MFLTIHTDTELIALELLFLPPSKLITPGSGTKLIFACSGVAKSAHVIAVKVLDSSGYVVLVIS